ncbi:hypothetical protein Vafri_11551, partial [Volvox africanus]
PLSAPFGGCRTCTYLWGASTQFPSCTPSAYYSFRRPLLLMSAPKVSTGKGATAGHVVPPLDPAWDPLVLEVRLDWPLGLLLGRDQLRRYNQLFALLLRLRRMQGQLDDAWKDLRIMDRQLQRDSSSSVPGGRMRDLQDLRNNMAHLVANLQIYIQTDVIEVNFSTLENKISTCQDFSEISSRTWRRATRQAGVAGGLRPPATGVP